jgi:hypothetical protein
MGGGIAARPYTLAWSHNVDTYSRDVYTACEVGTCQKKPCFNRSRTYASIC